MANLEISQQITIELDGNSPFEYVVVKEGDSNSRILAVTLLQNKQPFEIPQDCTARIKYYKPDGNYVLNDCTISDNKILVTYTAQMLAVPGTAKGEILLLQDERELKSATYYTKIVPEVYQTEGVISDKQFLSLAKVLTECDRACDEAWENARIAEAATEAAEEATEDAQTATQNAQTATTQAQTAKTNADIAAQGANTAATAADTATSRANAAAAACEGIAAGINTMTDPMTGYVYSLGVSGGNVYLERIS